MSDDQQPGQPPHDTPSPEATGDRTRSVNLGVVAGAVILVGLVGFAFYRQRGHETTLAPAGPESAPAQGEGMGAAGTAIAAATVNLSPEGRIATERYRCVCGCNDPLSVCTCTQTPGSIDMKQYVQEQVDQGQSPAEIDRAMVEKYGAAVLLGNPAAPRTAGP